jgi:acyl-CoA thioester hydrolase
MVVARTEVDYVSPACLDDLLHIFVRTAALGRSSFTTNFEIRRAADGQVLARIAIKYVNFDRATGKSMPLPESFRRAVAEYEERPIVS